MKGRALRRALQTSDTHRLYNDIPLITDSTELITPEIAQQYLEKNKYNRPVNWKRVEQYTDIMEKGEWKLTPQGIVFDSDGNLINGQNRLWAIIYSGHSVYVRISRGTPADFGGLLDRGAPQSARDLAARKTRRKHSPYEASIARGIMASGGILRPSVDCLAEQIERSAVFVDRLLLVMKGTKKTKADMMILSAICAELQDTDAGINIAKCIDALAKELTNELHPISPDKCWGRGAAFLLAMEKARQVVVKAVREKL